MLLRLHLRLNRLGSSLCPRHGSQRNCRLPHDDLPLCIFHEVAQRRYICCELLDTLVGRGITQKEGVASLLSRCFLHTKQLHMSLFLYLLPRTSLLLQVLHPPVDCSRCIINALSDCVYLTVEACSFVRHLA